MIYVSSPQQLGPVLAPPPTPFPWGVGEFLPSTLNGRGPSSGPGWGPAGVGEVPALPQLGPTQSCPPILSSISPPPPLETEDLLFSIIYNLKLGPPVLLH